MTNQYGVPKHAPRPVRSAPVAAEGSRRSIARATTAALLAVLVASASCQSYRARPLDLAAHRLAVAARLDDLEPLEDYIASLAESGAQVPERFDPSDGLVLAEGEVLALFQNPTLRLVRLEAGVALAERDTAGLWQDPVFGFDAADVLSPESLFDYGVTLGLSVPLSGRTGVERDRADALLDVARARVIDAEWRVRLEVRRAWSTWSAATLQAALAADAVERTERVAALASRLAELGEIGRADARLFAAELAGRRADLADARGRALSVHAELLGMLGLAPSTRIELQPQFAAPLAPSTGDGVERLIASNSTLAIHRAEYRAAEETLRLEVRKQYPDVTLAGGFGSESKDDRLLLGLSIPIPILDGNTAGIARARAERELARGRAETAFELLLVDLAAALVRLDAATQQRAVLDRDLVPLLVEQLEEVDRLAALGEVDAFLLLDSLERWNDATSRALALRLAELDATHAIVLLLGPDQSPPSPSHSR